MGTTLISNIGEFFTGDLATPTAPVSALLIADGRIAALDADASASHDREIDAGGAAVLPGLVEGSAGRTLSQAIAHGDLPGISFVLIDGEVAVEARSRQTPPPAAPARLLLDRPGCPLC